jgi:hypothetical protein
MGVATIGLTYRATSLQEDPWGLFLEITKGLNAPPNVRGTDVVVPARQYQIARNRLPHGHSLLLEGYLYATGETAGAQLVNIRDRMLDLFHGEGALFGPTATGILVATLENGLVASIVARTLNVLDSMIGPTAYRLSIEMEANWGPWVVEVPGS